MKTLKTVILSLLLLSCVTMPVLAQTKVATVDMQKLFNNYWKKKPASDALENRKTELRKEIKSMADGLDAAETEYKSLVEQANDQSLAPAARDKKKADADAKAKDINDTKSSLESFQRQAESQLSDQSQRMSTDLVQDIEKAISAQAKVKGYDLVLNTKTEAVLYAGPGIDITEDVLKQLNAGAPIDLNPAPAASTNAASATTP